MQNYFQQKQSISKPTLLASGIHVSQAELVIVEKQTEQAVKPRKQHNNDIPEVIKKTVGRYDPIHGTKTTSDFFNKKNRNYTFVRTSINNWKKKTGSKSSQTPFDK